MNLGTFEPLSETIRICVTPEHRFGGDGFLLSDFAAPRSVDVACDLCAGCGIIPALWFREGKTAPKTAYAVEIQPQAVEQLRRTASEGGLPEGRFVPVHADLRELRGVFGTLAGSFDLVTCNPPFTAESAGLPSENEARRIARQETLCTTGDVCAAAKKLLRFGGRLCLCQRPARLADVLEELRKHSLEPKRLRFIHQRVDSAPWLFLIEGRRGGKPSLKIEPPLIIEGEGGFSSEVLRIYGKEHNL